MSNIQTGAERMPHDLSHLGFLAGQIGRLITISTTPVIAGDSFEMDAVGALRLSPLRRGLRSEERFSRNAETDIVCRLVLEKKKLLALHYPPKYELNTHSSLHSEAKMKNEPTSNKRTNNINVCRADP